jgi:hypothetical protein
MKRRNRKHTLPEQRSVIIRALVESGNVKRLSGQIMTPKKGKGAKYVRDNRISADDCV